MTLQPDISAQLAEFWPVYDEIGKLRNELTRLQQAELAQAEFIEQTSDLEDELRLLTKELKDLAGPQQKMQLNEADVKPFRAQPKPYPAPHPFSAGKTPPANPVRQQPIQRARVELKKLVMRWGYVWNLTGDTRGRINRIADDPTRPLGEAIALLDWDTFQNRIGSEETEAAHLLRITSWGGALTEYRDRLLGEIDMLKTRYRLVLPILDAWIERDTDTGRENWDKQIAETNAAKEKEVDRLRNEIAQLTARG